MLQCPTHIMLPLCISAPCTFIQFLHMLIGSFIQHMCPPSLIIIIMYVQQLQLAHYHIITLHTCARCRAIGFVCRLLSSSSLKTLDPDIQASVKIVSPNRRKTGLNMHLAWPMNVTNSIYLLAIIATPIDRAYCRPLVFCSCAQVAWQIIRRTRLDVCIYCSSRTSHIYDHLCSTDAKCARGMCSVQSSIVTMPNFITCLKFCCMI